MGIAAPKLASHPTDGTKRKGAVPSALLVGAVSTAIAFAIVDLLFYVVSQQFMVWRQVRTEFAFSLPSDHYSTVIVGVLLGAAVAQSRTWIIPGCIGFVLYLLCFPTFGWSGPGDLFAAIEPLINLRYELMGIALMMVTITSMAWARRENLRSIATSAADQTD